MALANLLISVVHPGSEYPVEVFEVTYFLFQQVHEIACFLSAHGDWECQERMIGDQKHFPLVADWLHWDRQENHLASDRELVDSLAILTDL